MQNCLDCPFHQEIPDPDPYDSFCADDIAVVCTKERNPSQDESSKYVADRQEFRAVTCSCRPYNKRKEAETPEWCPASVLSSSKSSEKVVNTCMDCIHHKVIADPDPDDSFCLDDLAVVCSLARNVRQDSTSKFAADRQGFRHVAVACRPYNLEKEATIPDWCPSAAYRAKNEASVLEKKYGFAVSGKASNKGL